MLRRELPDRGENRDPGVATEVSYKADVSHREGVYREGTEVLIVPLLIVDLKPGRLRRPALRLRGLTSTISSERRFDMPSTLHCVLLYGKYRLLLALTDKNSVQTAFK